MRGDTPTTGRARRRRWPWVVGGVLGAVLVVLASAVAFVLWPRSPTPITEEDALAEFRQGGTTGPGGAGPAAGVYTYDADGTEKIDMGPLPLPTRHLPSPVTVVVRPDGGCWTLELNLMAEHTETTRLCRADDGSLSLPTQTKQEQVPGFEVGVRNDCEPAVLLGSSGAELPMACHEAFDVSGLALTVDFTGTTSASPGGPIAVGGDTVETVHLRLDLVGTGDLSGHWIEDWWVTSDGLPVRMDRDIDLDGPGHFVERSSLTLRSLEPRT